MNEYDFTNLNPNEFETLANDLLSRLYNLHIESFKPGKDLGIDGRFFRFENSPATIIQCKHYALSGFTKLLYDLTNTEIPKIKKLSPEKYIVTTSVPLSPQEKEKIKENMFPFIVNTSDIFGKEDLNSLLRQFPEVEKTHYKLWIASSAVLSQFLNAKIYNASQSVIADAYDKCANYVITSSHSQAKEKINTTNVLVITGDPGVGKTTLAEQLCLEFVADGYEFFAITNDIEDGFAVLTRESKQIFYFDDFLGKNYIETLRFNEDSRIMQFINTVAKSKHKKFILTSRTNILDQGYRVGPSFANGNIKNKEYLIDVSQYNHIDKAKILYSFLWRSDLTKDFLEQIIARQEYVNIIYHRNYNPRLLEFITSSEHVDLSTHNLYLQFIENALKNPAGIWEHPYNAQLDDASRAVVDLITFGNGNVAGDSLRKAYYNFQNSGLKNNKTHLANDFDSVMSILSRSFIKRTCALEATHQTLKYNQKDKIKFSLFNPSISDYVLSRYNTDYWHIADMIMLYEDDDGVIFLENAVLHNKELVKNVAKIICDRKKDDAIFCNSTNYLRIGNLLDSEDFNLLFKKYELSQVCKCIEENKVINEELLNFCNKILTLQSINCSEQYVANLIFAALECDMEYYDIINMSSILEAHLPENFHDEIVEKYYSKLLDAWKYLRLEEFAADNVEKFTTKSYVQYEDDCDIEFTIDEDKLASLIAEDTADLYTPIDISDVKDLLYYIDLESIVSDYYCQASDDESGGGGGYSSGKQDIHGIFEGFLTAKFG